MGPGKSIYMICQTEPILVVQYSHLWPLEKSVQNLYYVCILATYGPMKNLTSVFKQNCHTTTYGPGKIFTCFVKLNPYWMSNIVTYGPLKKLYRTCTMSVS